MKLYEFGPKKFQIVGALKLNNVEKRRRLDQGR